MDIFYPIKLFADWLIFSVFSIAPKTLLAEAVNFFVYDTTKIFILLSVVIFIISLIRSFLPPEKIRFILSRRNKYIGHVAASIFGIITPFCSCSAIPLFLGFVRAGVPLGITFSFLVASPMVNEVAVIMLFGLFGLKIAFVYIASGLTIAILSGVIIGRMKAENLVESFVYQNSINAKNNLSEMKWSERFSYAKNYAWDILKKVWIYVLVGIGIGAWIHGYVPIDFLVKYGGADKWYAVPFAVLIGIPLYSNAAGIVPLISALTEKGVAIGTTLAFMMAVTALSLPQFMILKRVIKIKLIVIFAGIVAIGIIFTGYFFNWIL